VVFAVLVLVAVALSTIVRQVVDDQEDRLLDRRASEASLYLESLIGTVEVGLQASGAFSLAAERLGVPDVFLAAAEQLRTVGGSVIAVDVADDGATVAWTTNDDFAEGAPLTGTRLDAVRRAVVAAEEAAAADAPAPMTSTSALAGDDGRERRVGFALAGGLTPPGMAVYVEYAFRLDEPVELQGRAFADLDAAVYAASEPTAGNLLLVAGSGRVPGDGDVGSASLPVGADRWLVVAEARTSLVGSLASRTPWIVLAAGLVVAGFGALLAEVLLRRQSYALALVEERTAELEEAQAQAVRAERLAAIGGLASAVGHELRNPLGVISNAHYLLRAKLGPESDEHVRRHLATAERETAAATLIVSDLLEFARGRDPIPTEVPIDELVGEALEVAPPPSGVSVERDVDAGLVVRADRDQLRQVLLNLLTNGYDAVGDSGSVGVSTASSDGDVRLTVWDTGVGVDDGAKDRVFEPFFTSKAKGIGLGLTVTRRIVEAHGGELTVHDRTGGGTRFEIVLPSANGSSS
jgi:signal transduction histidine kinase